MSKRVIKCWPLSELSQGCGQTNDMIVLGFPWLSFLRSCSLWRNILSDLNIAIKVCINFRTQLQVIYSSNKSVVKRQLLLESWSAIITSTAVHVIQSDSTPYISIGATSSPIFSSYLFQPFECESKSRLLVNCNLNFIGFRSQWAPHWHRRQSWQRSIFYRGEIAIFFAEFSKGSGVFGD